MWPRSKTAAVSYSGIMGTNGEDAGADGDGAGAPDCTSAVVVDGGRVADGWDMGSSMVVVVGG
jgi:hypothetical protein